MTSPVYHRSHYTSIARIPLYINIYCWLFLSLMAHVLEMEREFDNTKIHFDYIGGEWVFATRKSTTTITTVQYIGNRLSRKKTFQKER